MNFYLLILALIATFYLSDAQSTQATTIPLNNINGQVYSGEMLMGTPPQSFQVIFDIGYSNIVLTSSFCSNCSEANKYNTINSSTSIYEYRSFDISGYPLFSSSPLNAEVYMDKMNVFGYNVSAVQFYVAMNGVYDFEQMNVDGLFGLGLIKNVSIGNLVPPLKMLMQQQTLPQQLFSIYLTPAVNQPGSFITLGGYDTAVAPNGFNYYNLSASNTWQITINDFGLGNTSYLTGGNALQGVLFTSLPYIYGSSDLMSGILSQFSNQISCSDINNYPNIYFKIGEDKYEIPPSVYMVDQGSSSCAPALNGDADFSVDVPEGQIYIGTVFFRNFYAVFDMANQRIGLTAPVAPPASPSAATSLTEIFSLILSIFVSCVYLLI